MQLKNCGNLTRGKILAPVGLEKICWPWLKNFCIFEMAKNTGAAASSSKKNVVS